MKWDEILTDPKLWRTVVKKILFVIVFTGLFVFSLFHWERVAVVWNGFISMLSPFLVGMAIAFIINVFLKLFEEKIFGFLTRRGDPAWLKIKRGLCILLSYTLVFVILGLAIFYIIPEFISSLKSLTTNLPIYAQEFSIWAMEQLKKLNITQEQINRLQIDWSGIIGTMTQVTTDFVGSVFSITMSVTSGIISLILSLIFSIYMLCGKEKMIRNVKRMVYAFLPRLRARKVVAIGSLANRIFSGFVTGQMTEAVIIGVLCYISMRGLEFPYALLISVIISMTALVPILGAYLGGALGAFILLLVDPVYSLWFLIFIVLLQQLEGNIIYPRVVGGSIGLPGIWVLLAVLACGNLGGIPGILLGVPTCSLLYTLLRGETSRRLKRKDVTEEEINTPVPVFEDEEPITELPLPTESPEEEKKESPKGNGC